MNFKDIKGKTIKDAYAFDSGLGVTDDEWLKLEFTDGSSCVIEGSSKEHPGDDCRIYILPFYVLPGMPAINRLPERPNQ